MQYLGYIFTNFFLNLPEIDFCRYVLFQDIFSGYFDTVLKEGACCKYYEKAIEFETLKKGSTYEYLFDLQIALLKAMYFKHDLGIKLRRAYQNKDLDALKILHGDILKTIDAVKEFHKANRQHSLFLFFDRYLLILNKIHW